MNSLAYLSRQFDVLASPRTPPSTPVLETAPLLAAPDAVTAASLKRVQTWSTRSLAGAAAAAPSGASSYSPWTLKRSYSSPAEVQPGESSFPPPASSSSSGPSTSSPAMRSAPSTPPRPASRRPSVASTEKALRPKLRSASLFRRVFFVHVLAFAFWNYLCTLWRAVRGHVAGAAAAEDASDEEEGKDEEDEGKSEKHQHPAVQVEQPPPIAPPTLPAVLTAHHPSLVRMHTDSLLDTKAPLPDGASPPRTAEHSRTPTPALGARKTALHLPKTLVLDLDETLIHSTSRPMHSPRAGLLGSLGIAPRGAHAGHTVEVTLGGRSTLYHVYKRPFVDYFLRKVSAWYTLVIFTASMQEYADPVIDWLDAGRGILGRRLFRESCTQLPNGSYTKDLSLIEQDLSRVCLVDNSPICYTINEANGIPIEGWTNDPHDEALLDLLPVLDSLRFTSDVRRVLGIRGFS